jgi:ectoine hydroxylase-related dioxygenase (phytanoyl-CoA dioxygenase family)
VRQLSASLEHFHEHGWMRLPQAIDAAAAAEMRDLVWAELAADGILRKDPATWRVERPAHLQRLRDHPAFQVVGSEAVLAAIDAIMQGRAYESPRNWGSLFLAFPSVGEWEIPQGGWHIDAKYTSALDPPGGVKIFALLSDVAPRGGATLVVGGSHRLVHRWFSENPPPRDAKGPDMRRLLRAHPYLGSLQSAADAAQRIARFMGAVEDDGGIPLQVVELSGAAGDVFLLHPLTLHAAAPNAGPAPRFMLSGGITNDMWGWQQP